MKVYFAKYGTGYFASENLDRVLWFAKPRKLQVYCGTMIEQEDGSYKIVDEKIIEL